MWKEVAEWMGRHLLWVKEKKGVIMGRKGAEEERRDDLRGSEGVRKKEVGVKKNSDFGGREEEERRKRFDAKEEDRRRRKGMKEGKGCRSCDEGAQKESSRAAANQNFTKQPKTLYKRCDVVRLSQ